MKQEIVNQLDDIIVLLSKLKRDLKEINEKYESSELDDLATQGLIEEILTNVNLSNDLISISKNYLN